MSDLITAMGMTLMVDKEPRILPSIELPYPEIMQEMIDYTNSKEYQELIFKEWREKQVVAGKLQ